MSKNQLFVHFRRQKNSTSRTTIIYVSVNHAGTKLSSICSPQMYKNNPLIRGVPQLAGVIKLASGTATSNRIFSRFLSLGNRRCPVGRDGGNGREKRISLACLKKRRFGPRNIKIASPVGSIK